MSSRTFWGMQARWLASFAVLLVAATAAIVFWPVDHRRASRSITIAQAGDFFLYAPLYVAIDAGLFRNHQLDVRLVSTGGDEKTWAAVIGGSASFGVADPTFVAIADSRGRPGRVVANIVNGVPFWGITFRSEIRPFADPKGLNSFVVATFPSPSTAFTLQKRMFSEAGLTTRIREGAFGTLIAMLKAGAADIALELEPNVSQAVRDGAHVLYSMQQIYGDFAITGLTTTPETIAAQPGMVGDVVCALQEALDYIRTRPDAALQLLEKRFPEIDKAVAKAAFERVAKAGIIPAEAVTGESAWQQAITLRTEAGEIRSPKPMTAYVDNSFAESALQRCRYK